MLLRFEPLRIHPHLASVAITQSLDLLVPLQLLKELSPSSLQFDTCGSYLFLRLDALPNPSAPHRSSPFATRSGGWVPSQWPVMPAMTMAITTPEGLACRLVVYIDKPPAPV